MHTKILTLDAGTTGLKATLFDLEGKALAAAVSPYAVHFPRCEWAEQPYETFLHAACQAGRAAVEAGGAEGIAAIGLSGTMNGCLPVDAMGNALHPNIIHADTRAVSQLDTLRAVIGEETYYQRTGNRIDVHYSLPKILWLKENLPDIYRKTRWFLNTKDAIHAFLTGSAGVTDYSDASLTGALCLEKRAWDEDLLFALDLDVNKMPRLCVSHAVEGRLTENAAALLGLTPGIPVMVGAGDGASAAHGAGLHDTQGAYCNIGSSAWMASLSQAPVLDADRRVFNYLDMDGVHYNVCGTLQNGASAFDWAVEHLLPGASGANGVDYSALEALARQSPPGSQGVFFLPTLLGERTPWWDPNTRGTLVGFSLHHGNADIARAVYEGIAQGLRQCAEVLRENGMRFESLMLIGGGASSGLWPSMMASMLGTSVRVHAHPRSATSLGAAMAAGVGVGIFEDYAKASSMAKHSAVYTPDQLSTDAYATHYAVYHSLYARLREAYRDIAAYQAACAREDS